MKAANHATKYRTLTDAGFSIDDVVTLLSLRRAVVDDRKQWFALRREVCSSFKEDDTDVSRTIALLSTDIQDEVARIADTEVARLVQD